MATFNAVRIEHTMAGFFGTEIADRLTFFDADVFRGGEPKELVEVLLKVADKLEERITWVEFPANKPNIKGHVTYCIGWLREIAGQMMEGGVRKREDYHWEVFGALIAGIRGLLETLEAQAVVQ